MNAIYAIVYVEAWRPQDFNGVQTPWPRDTGGPSNQLSYEATDVGSWSFVGCKEPVRNECEVMYMKYFIYWTHKRPTWKPGWELNCLKRFQVQLLTTVIEKKTAWKTPGKFLLREGANNKRSGVVGSATGFKIIIIILSPGLNIVANVDWERSLPCHDCTCHRCHLLSR